MKKIAIGLQPQLKQAEAILSPGLLFTAEAVHAVRPLGKRFVLCCDEHVMAVWGEKWLRHLKEGGLNTTALTFPPGEQEKSRERKALLEDALLSEKHGRETCLIALGGGVTTDLIGFLASTYCRGIPLVLVPTTLLAMIDAAIGGKTGVNTAFGKNLIGTFYPAELTLIDPCLLSTLSVSERTSGMAEAIKYALIKSPELFQFLSHSPPQDPLYLQRLIYECILIKAEIVEIDFEEKTGLRRILNFGHTIAHALEWLEEYNLGHGEAVAIGMLVESYLSVKMGMLSSNAFATIDHLIRSFPFGLHISQKVTLQQMKEAFLLDKKGSRFVLLERIGACAPFEGEYCTSIPESILDEALGWMISQFGARK